MVRQVSLVALIKIHLQFTIAKEHAGCKVRPQPDPRFETIMGFPSATTIYDLRTVNQSLPMSAVHKQWWLALDLQVGTPAIQDLEPAVARVHGRPSVTAVATRATSRQPISSTRREPSAFETIGRAPHLCKECRRPGHDVYNCPVLRNQRASLFSPAPTSNGGQVWDVLPLSLGIRVPMSVCSATVGRGAMLRKVGMPGPCGGIVEAGGQGEALGRQVGVGET